MLLIQKNILYTPKIYHIYLLYPYFELFFGQKYLTILRFVLCIKKLVIDLLMILNKSVIVCKKSLIIIIPNKNLNQIINKTYNAR